MKYKLFLMKTKFVILNNVKYVQDVQYLVRVLSKLLYELCGSSRLLE